MLYEDLRPRIRTGDALLFRGRGGISWWLGRLGPYTHQATALVDRMGVFAWESTTLSTVRDVDSGLAVRGVQVVPLSERVATYRGEIWWRSLRPGLSRGQEQELFELRAELSRVPYERSWRNLLRAWLHWLPGLRAPDPTSLFCTELGAMGLERVGVLEPVRPVDRWAPSDWRDGGPIEAALAAGWSYAPAVRLERAVRAAAA